MSAIRPGDRVRTPRGLVGTVEGFVGGRAMVRYDQLPPADDPLAYRGIDGRERQSAHFVLLPPGLLKAVGRIVRGVAGSAGDIRRRWTAAEDARVRESYARGGRRALADELGRTEAAVAQRAARLGVDAPRGFWTEAEDERLRAAYVERGAKAVAAELGRTPRAVSGRAQRIGATQGRRGQRPKCAGVGR